jgi:hypothetical protein
MGSGVPATKVLYRRNPYVWLVPLPFAVAIAGVVAHGVAAAVFGSSPAVAAVSVVVGLAAAVVTAVVFGPKSGSLAERSGSLVLEARSGSVVVGAAFDQVLVADPAGVPWREVMVGTTPVWVPVGRELDLMQALRSSSARFVTREAWKATSRHADHQ